MKVDSVTLAWVAGLGALGAVLRYLVGVGLRAAGHTFPTWTLLVNVVGCFVMGYLMGYVQQRSVIHPGLHPGVTSGLLGALTTFSAFSVESWELGLARGSTWALVNIAANVVLGLLAAWLGMQWSR